MSGPRDSSRHLPPISLAPRWIRTSKRSCCASRIGAHAKQAPLVLPPVIPAGTAPVKAVEIPILEVSSLAAKTLKWFSLARLPIALTFPKRSDEEFTEPWDVSSDPVQSSRQGLGLAGVESDQHRSSHEHRDRDFERGGRGFNRMRVRWRHTSRHSDRLVRTRRRSCRGIG